MNRQTLAVLVVINAVLLAAFMVISFSPQPAQAQFAGRADYIMVSGRPSAGQQDVVYVMETTTGRVVALTYASANKKMEIRGAADLAKIVN